MICIYCSSKTQTVNSRSSQKHPSTWRRKYCKNCGAVFTTRENPDYSASLRIVKPSRRLEPFSTQKLFFSIHSSLTHRKNAIQDASGITETITLSILSLSKAGLIEQTVLTQEAAKTLDKFDKAAATYYRAHYC